MVSQVSRISVRSWEGWFPDRHFDGICQLLLDLFLLLVCKAVSGSTFRWHLSHLLIDLFLLLVEVDQQQEEIQKKMTEMLSKRRSRIRPSQDRTDTRDTRETIGLFYNCKNICRNIYIYIYFFFFSLVGMVSC